MDATQTLLSEIEAFLSRTGMEASTFGQKAVHDWRQVERLRAGGSVSLRKAERLRTYMEQHRARGAESSEKAA